MALLIGVMMIILMITARVLIPIGQATDRKAGARTAADAASLAAADAMKRAVPTEILIAAGRLLTPAGFGTLLDGLDCAAGSGPALTFAGGNRAGVTSYTCDPLAGRVDVWVRGDDATMRTGDHAQAHAQARYGIRLAPCAPRPDVPPAPAPVPAPPPGTPPVDAGWTVACGVLVLHFVVDGTTGRPTLATTPAQVRAQFAGDSRLTA